MGIFFAVVAVTIVGFFATMAVGFGTAITFLVMTLVIVLALCFWMSSSAKRQVDITVNADPQVVSATVQKMFRFGWKSVSGPAGMNYQARWLGIGSAKMTKPVLSIDCEDAGGGTTAVSIWMSAWASKFGQIGAVDRVIAQRWKLVRKLETLGAPAKPVADRSASQPNAQGPASPPVFLPQPGRYTTDDQLRTALDEVGSMQQAVSDGSASVSQISTLGQEVTARLQGVVEAVLNTGGSATLHSTVVEPIGEWTIGTLAPMWIVDQGATPTSAAAKKSYFEIMAFYEKYAFLKETGGRPQQSTVPSDRGL